MTHPSASPLVKDDSGIHLPCNSLLIQDPRHVFVAQVPGLRQTNADQPHPRPRISRARKDVLKLGMDEVRATIDTNPYTIATLHRLENLPFAEVAVSFGC
jgi:hypothetical protein